MRLRNVKSFILVGLTVRIAAALFHLYVAPLPDGIADAVKFERIAWELASGGIGNILANFHYDPAYYYALGLSYVYGVTGRSPLLAQGLSVAVGILCITLTWRLAKEIWSDRAASVAAWFVALMPALIMYSALTMREVYFTAVLLGGLWFVVIWVRSNKWSAALTALALFAFGALFHTGMVAALGAFGLLIFGRAVLLFMQGLRRGSLHPAALLLIALVAAVVIAAIVVDPNIPKMGSLSSLLTPAPYLQILANRVHGNAAYPDWLVTNSAAELAWIVPAKAAYLLGSPFVWDIREAPHIVGLIDGTIYLILGLVIAAHWREISSNRAALAILFILVALIIVFAVGTGNFGTALRHRAKLFPLIAVLAAPFIPRLVWNSSSSERAKPSGAP